MGPAFLTLYLLPLIVIYIFAIFQPTGENGVTRASIVIDMERDDSLAGKGLAVQFENKVQQVSASKQLI